jgi:hypothetical protein
MLESVTRPELEKGLEIAKEGYRKLHNPALFVYIGVLQRKMLDPIYLSQKFQNVAWNLSESLIDFPFIRGYARRCIPDIAKLVGNEKFWREVQEFNQTDMLKHLNGREHLLAND